MNFSEVYKIKNRISENILFPQTSGRNMIYENFSGFAGKKDLELINGIGISIKNNQFQINFYLEDEGAYDFNFIRRTFNIPQICNISTLKIGKIKLQTTRRRRPAFPGCSVSHIDVTAGTLGCFVIDKNNNIFILSNNHVLANNNNADFDDLIFQPGIADGGLNLNNTYGVLHAYMEINSNHNNIMDAAIASVIDETQIDTRVPRIGQINGGKNPELFMLVEKFGRTSKYTQGIIEDINADVLLDIDGERVRFTNQIRIKGTAPTIPFSKGGDSGSIVVCKNDKWAVGMIFAGNESTNTSFANPIIPILDAFDVNILIR